jgi:FkbM family methyltransferase
MLFPQSDRYWLDTLNFIKLHAKSEDSLLAPDEFSAVFHNTYPYDETFSGRKLNFEWALIHKGRLEELDGVWFKQLTQEYNAVFANEVFVVFSSRQDLSPATSEHMESFWALVKQLYNQSYTAIAVNSSRLSINLRDIQVKKIAAIPSGKLEALCRNSCQTAYLGNDTILCRVLGKYLFYADAKDVNITPHLCLDGYWESWITIAMIRTLQPGWQCIDVGANHGYYSIIMADVVGGEGCVQAVEPNPRLSTLLKQTIELNGLNKQAKVLQKAVSDTNGEKALLVIPSGRGLNASIHELAKATDETTEVETVTLDSLTQDWSRVDFVKIDAEGAEEGIWRGMRDTVSRNKDIVIIMEFRCDRYTDPKSFLLDIQAAGFALRYVDYDTKIKDLTVEQCLTERQHEDWMLFLKRD